ncbi:unnamed protein product [Sphagnum jensenii]|uniref:Uncharacterized protein n=1 Tax=Sphagnum jensenii TaxID=128206 RepID=A0ABP1BI12_9BRYO
MCTSSSSSSSSRRGTIPIIARALTTCGYHHVRKPPPLYIPAGSPRRPQPPGTAKLRRQAAAIRTRRFSKPAPTGGAPWSCANNRPKYPKVLIMSPSSASREPPVYFECVRDRLAGTTKLREPPYI